MSNKKSSYQKLKLQRDELFKLYRRARKKLCELNQGIEGDDILFDFDVTLMGETDVKRKS